MGAPVQDKIAKNGMGCTLENGSSPTGVFVTMSRSNHSCVSNVEHYFVERQGIKRLTSCRNIAAGEELCIAYIGPAEEATATRRRQLRERYGFGCTCKGCVEPAMTAQLDRLIELDAAIPALAQRPQTVHLAVSKGQELIRLLDTLQNSVASYERTYYDLFQVAVLKSSKRGQAVAFIEKVAEAAVRAYGEDDPLVARCRGLAASPAEPPQLRPDGLKIFLRCNHACWPPLCCVSRQLPATVQAMTAFPLSPVRLCANRQELAIVKTHRRAREI